MIEHGELVDGQWYYVEDGSRIRLRSTGGSTAKFGECECCGKPVDDTYIMARHIKRHGVWLSASPYAAFGHRSCLIDATTKGSAA